VRSWPVWGSAVLALLSASEARSTDVGALERQVRAAYGDRAHLLEDRSTRMAEASGLADEIAQHKLESGPNTRAGPKLAEVLKRFDRLAATLDALDLKIIDADRVIIGLRRKFDDAANAEAARLAARPAVTSIGDVARALEALDESRRRVEALAAEPAFRPVLDVTLAPTDGSIEVEHKLSLLEAERDRARAALDRCDAETRVFSERILLKRQLSTQLEAAARAGGSDLILLRREAEVVAEALHDLSVQRDVRSRQRSDLVLALAALDRRMTDFRIRLRELAAPKVEGR
jgi:hypothetical protein